MKNIDNIINKYINAAIKHGECSIDGNYKEANRNYDILKKIYKMIEKDKDNNSFILIELIKNDNNYVKTWAAAHCLVLNIDIANAKKVLNSIVAKKIQHLSFDAKMTLKVWKEGKLKF